MKMCNEHWLALKTEIEDLGIGHLIPSSADNASENVESQIKERRITAENFDPLMAAYIAILGTFLEDVMGSNRPENLLVLLTSYACPMCRVKAASKEGVSENWLKGAAMDQLAHARLLKLAPMGNN